MDDVTSILQAAACTSRLLKRLDELVSWARKMIKPSKSQSLNLQKGVKNDKTIFVAGGDKTPLLVQQPIQHMGRQYTIELSDKHLGNTIQKQLSDGLSRIDQSQIPGKYTVWCNQFTLYHQVRWPQKTEKYQAGFDAKGVH